MSRRYSDRIDVVVAERLRSDVPTSEAPALELEPPRAFIWRGSRYQVTEVLSRWSEAEKWWRREVPHDCSVDSSHFPDDAVVWRVAARTRKGETGVFELRNRPGVRCPGWFLIRAYE